MPRLPFTCSPSASARLAGALCLLGSACATNPNPSATTSNSSTAASSSAGTGTSGTGTGSSSSAGTSSSSTGSTLVCALQNQQCLTIPCCNGVCDDACECTLGGQACSAASDCCSNSCDGSGLCACAGSGAACTQAANCCSGICAQGTCACAPLAGGCLVDADCCNGTCLNQVCTQGCLAQTPPATLIDSTCAGMAPSRGQPAGCLSANPVPI